MKVTETWQRNYQVSAYMYSNYFWLKCLENLIERAKSHHGGSPGKEININFQFIYCNINPNNK